MSQFDTRLGEIKKLTGVGVEPREIEKRYGVEIEVLRRLGMKWAVLKSLYYVISNKGSGLPPSVIRKLRTARLELRTARFMIESGCFSVCDVSCALNKAEPILIQGIASSRKGFENFDHWLNLLGKAMRAQLKPEEVRELPFIKPIIQNCEFLKCTCGE